LEGERRSLPQLALDPDLAPMQAHEAPGEREPQPRALALLGIVGADLAELLEDRGLIAGRDADPRVADRELHRAVGGYGLDPDPSPRRGELDGVGAAVHEGVA